MTALSLLLYTVVCSSEVRLLHKLKGKGKLWQGGLLNEQTGFPPQISFTFHPPSPPYTTSSLTKLQNFKTSRIQCDKYNIITSYFTYTTYRVNSIYIPFTFTICQNPTIPEYGICPTCSPCQPPWNWVRQVCQSVNALVLHEIRTMPGPWTIPTVSTRLDAPGARAGAGTLER